MKFPGPEPKVRPVIVYIHGGKFAWGSGNLSDGTVFAAYADVVFVAINYRLGVLGRNIKRSTKRSSYMYHVLLISIYIMWVRFPQCEPNYKAQGSKLWTYGPTCSAAFY